MLHLGKHKCLSYEEQAGEYETEVNSVSLHIIKTVLQWWVNRRRFGQTQGGKKFPKLSIWANNEQLYYRASDAVCVARLRSLRVLFSEVRKRKPKDYDAEGGEDPKVVEKKSNPGFFEKRRIKKQEAEKERRREEAALRKARADALGDLPAALAQVEAEIARYEAGLEKLQARLADPRLYEDAEKARQTSAKQVSVSNRLESLYERWESLGAEIEAIEQAL